jgi:hypothetical protein
MGERRSISRWTISRQLAVAEPQAVELRAEVAVAEAERVQVVAAEAERVQVVAAEAVQARLQVREHLPQADVAQQARLQLLPFLSPQELLRPQQQVRRVQAAAVGPKQVVAVDGVDRAAEVAVAVVADRPLEEIARAPQFPAWRSSMRCLQLAPIPMWRLVRVARKLGLADVFQIRC